MGEAHKLALEERRRVIATVVDHRGNDTPPLLQGKLVGFSHEPEDRQTVYASLPFEVDQSPQAVLVDFALVGKRGGEDGEYALNMLWMSALSMVM